MISKEGVDTQMSKCVARKHSHELSTVKIKKTRSGKTGLAKWLAVMCHWPNTADELIISGCDWVWVLADCGFGSLRCCDATAKRKKTSGITFRQSGRGYAVTSNQCRPFLQMDMLGKKMEKDKTLANLSGNGHVKKKNNQFEAKHKLLAISFSHLWWWTKNHLG